jgi:hypothetical protein
MKLWQRTMGSSWRSMGTLAAVLMLAHACFTLVVRRYVVPTFTPDRHWMYGLWKTSDSMYFFAETQALADLFRQAGWQALGVDVPAHLAHAKVFATLLYVTNTSGPYVVFAFNGVLFALGGLLLYRLLRLYGATRPTAWLLALLLTLVPTNLLNHSEFLREPLVVPAILSILLGIGMLTSLPGVAPRRLGVIVGAVVLAATGYVAAVSLRPYLMLVLILGLLVTTACYFVQVFWRRGMVPALLGMTPLVALLLFTVAHARFGLDSVLAYGEARRRPDAANTEAVVAKWEAALKARRDQLEKATAGPKTEEGQSEWKREDFLAGVGCTVKWSRSSWLPTAADAKLEALSCVRQSFQRYCDEAILGFRADEHCDTVVLTGAAQTIGHLPHSTAFGLLTPYPRMWSPHPQRSGTGLRRFTLKFEATFAYVLLAGLVGFFIGRGHGASLPLIAGTVVMLTVYAMAVPTPHVLMRMRVGFYLPLLAAGGLGWTRVFNVIKQRRTATRDYADSSASTRR